MMYQFHKDMTAPASDEIFVLGSNLEGYHGSGSARFGHEQLGAEWGVGVGMTGKCYALPTKATVYKSLTLNEIQAYVDDLIEFATLNPQLKFFVTAIGTNRAGYKHSDIAPLFKGSPKTFNFPEEWKLYLS